MDSCFLNSEIGLLKITGDNDGIAEVAFTDILPDFISAEIPSNLAEAVKQLQEYFDGKRHEFQLVLNPKGTIFQKSVWQQLQTVGFGKTKTYQQMANELGDPKVIRAAASANGKNPIAIIIPCHRVIGSDGSLTGYAGGLHRKKWLLAHESPVIQISLF